MTEGHVRIHCENATLKCDDTPMELDFSKELPATCYLPNAADDLAEPEIPDLHETYHEDMGPIGPCAVGRVDLSQSSGLTGIRPAVDTYSITRVSMHDWKERNRGVFLNSLETTHRSDKCELFSKNSLTQTFSVADQVQNNTTQKQIFRAKIVEKWKNTMERAIKAQAEEISALEDQKNQIKRTMAVYKIPEAIASECLDRRSSRSDTEQVNDIPEKELIREISLIAEIRETLNRSLHNMEVQQTENRSAIQRLEHNWSDKKITLQIEQINCELNNRSTTKMLRPGAGQYKPDQPSEEYWECMSKTTLEECEAVRQKSAMLRSTLEAILMNGARDLRTQADTVERALSSRIACMQEAKVKLEKELEKVLRCLANTELTIDKLHAGIKSMTDPLKVAQTRQYNRNERPCLENCRDITQIALIDEVNCIHEGITRLTDALAEAEATKKQLIDTRYNLEQEILFKRRSIIIDRDRCQVLRTHFPSTNALCGH